MDSGWPWHDLHIHTRPHSPDAHWRATLPAMLKQAVRNGVRTVGLAILLLVLGLVWMEQIRYGGSAFTSQQLARVGRGLLIA